MSFFPELSAILLVACLLPSARAASPGGTDLKERLRRADAENAIDIEGLLPWHLKVELQFLDSKKEPAGVTGTIEEWWTGATGRRVVYTMPEFTATEVVNPQGTFISKATAPVELTQMLAQFIHPAAGGDLVDASTPEIRTEKFGSVALECITLSQPIMSRTPVPLGLFPTYCFEPGKDTLRSSFNLGSQAFVRNSLGVFQKHTVATKVTLAENGASSIVGKVVILSTSDNSPPELDKVDGLTSTSGAAARIPGDVIAGTILKKGQPIYPERARLQHISGAVVLQAIIGRDGHIVSLRPVKVPDPDLALAAIRAVRQWVYKPYLVNGEPTEVDTTITVTFHMSPG